MFALWENKPLTEKSVTGNNLEYLRVLLRLSLNEQSIEGLRFWALWLEGALVVSNSNRDKASPPRNMQVVIFFVLGVLVSVLLTQKDTWKGWELSMDDLPSPFPSPSYKDGSRVFLPAKRPRRGCLDAVCIILCIFHWFLVWNAEGLWRPTSHNASVCLSQRFSTSSVSPYSLHTVNLMSQARHVGIVLNLWDW